MDHIEVSVKGRRLVDRGHGQIHVGGKRAKHHQREVALGILDGVQMLDQEIAASPFTVLAFVAEELAKRRQGDGGQVASAELVAKATLGSESLDGHGVLVVIGRH